MTEIIKVSNPSSNRPEPSKMMSLRWNGRRGRRSMRAITAAEDESLFSGTGAPVDDADIAIYSDIVSLRFACCIFSRIYILCKNIKERGNGEIWKK